MTNTWVVSCYGTLTYEGAVDYTGQVHVRVLVVADSPAEAVMKAKAVYGGYGAWTATPAIVT